jgi:prepilin-type N-terminal cleavage/methylation domain-containing protein
LKGLSRAGHRTRRAGYQPAAGCQPAPLRPDAGVTLMELMIAVMLLSLLSVGLLFALRIGLNTYSKAQAKLMDNRRVAGAQRILEQELAGLVPVVADCGAGTEGGGNKAQFFQGEPEVMRFVSTFSLQGAWRGRPQILEIFVIPGLDGAGVRLVVNEIPYTGPQPLARICMGQNRFLPVSAAPTSFVLADKLAFCRFTFLDQPVDISLPLAWFPRFVGKTWPQGVRIEMAPLVPDPSRLQPASIVAPIHVFRHPEIQYGDF